MKTKTLIAGLCMLAGIVSCTGTSNTKCGATNEETSQELEKMETHVYEGLLPAASGPGIEYVLTIHSCQHSGDGTFTLALTYKEAEDGKDKTFTYTGKRMTLRGIPEDDNATVWQCISEDGKETFNFLREDENKLTLLNDQFEKPQTQLNYSLTRTE
ncbi:MAG: copper resistance protein NlpE N-terminal domain-containing protein [Bacteroides sp.]|nr:copper resistance protein NlpE N-terminal domain-containing protein [Bacteroides sp.]MCM1447237.1 copper resistance protein NlpE N-terminal domain-containing protein [Bacteroides sp.]